ncbi:MAG: dTDP-4-amino-4,6-dideoxygalactose transaminase [Chloroflexi bacterium]|nr:dTDP-4-amino-4,6-dideoxygalactose transaminase [Chloroflexota bacterium]
MPLTKPYYGPEEEAAVLAVLRTGNVGGDGEQCKAAEAYMRERFGVKHALLTTSCTHAMELALMACGIGPGDEVILPSFTFTSTANVILRQGARPVFAEIEEATFNLDPEDIKHRISPRTRAIMPVHYAGIGCRMDEIMEIAQRYGLLVIEDAAQGVGAKYNGRWLGAIGTAGCYSFHVTKNVTCGEGGALLTDDDQLAERAEIIREKGTNRSQFLRGQVDKYTWVDWGSSFVLSDLLAAVLVQQLRKMDEINAKRRVIWEYYYHRLEELALEGQIILPALDPLAESNWHIFAIRTDLARRDKVLAALRARGIGATFHYIPLHSSPYGRKMWGYTAEDLPITEKVSASLIRLPIYPDLTPQEQEYIIDSLYEIYAEI